MRVLPIPGSTLSALPRHVLANSFKTSKPSSLPGLTSLNRSGFDTTSLYHFDAAERAPSTASKADIHPPSAMSALPPKADIGTHSWDVRFVPKADILRCGKERRYSITSSARASSDCGTVSPSALAVLRLMASSNFAGCCTGKSAGVSPLRIRFT